MKNQINKLKQNLTSIHWPSREEVVKDTVTCVVTSAVLATAIGLWTAGIEYVVTYILSLF